MLIAKSDGVEFTVQEGQFCPALAKVVKTMKKDHHCSLFLVITDGRSPFLSQYGFGEKGKPIIGDEGAIPQNATLQITLELVLWKTASTITDDKKVVKKILIPKLIPYI